MARRGQGPLLLLLLPQRLEDFDGREWAEELLQQPEVVAVDPPRTPYTVLARIPDAFSVSMASKQARRLRRRLPGDVAAVAIFDPRQYPLARGLLAQLPDAALLYGRRPDPLAGVDARRRARLRELHLMAEHRATLAFDGSDPAPLWERLGAQRSTRPWSSA